MASEAKQLEQILETFKDEKETEENWADRDKALSKLREIVNKNTDFCLESESFMQFLRSFQDALIRTVTFPIKAKRRFFTFLL
jgi:sugar-specific transcriptional regulator TrmB